MPNERTRITAAEIEQLQRFMGAHGSLHNEDPHTANRARMYLGELLHQNLTDKQLGLKTSVFVDAARGVTSGRLKWKDLEAAMRGRMSESIELGKSLGRMALYFGCWNSAGHFLNDVHGRTVHHKPADLPWDDGLMDTGLLKNGRIPDQPNGKVYWTGGGKAFWYAFYWWDRSVDTRGACNSGFYVRGFGWPESEEAFAYACEQFPHVVKRQKYPLVLQPKLAWADAAKRLTESK